MNYEEKLELLDEGDFFNLFSRFNAEPRWVMSAGKKAIQIIGHCHHGDNHSALFDPSTLKVNCFSECGRGMQLHTWVKQALDMQNPQDAKDFLEDWIDNQEIDFSDRVPRAGANFEYKERPFVPTHIEPVAPMDKTALKELYDKEFDTTKESLAKLLWHTEDGIDIDILAEYEVAYYTEHGTIILPHHNINGDIVGLYERNFNKLRKEVKKEHPDLPYTALIKFPRAKYVPLLRAEDYRDEDKTSWSFPNSLNLYGLHKALNGIRKEKKVIIFEGGKSVMLAKQYGFPYAVATHTFGVHVNHIAMLYEASQCQKGELEVILAFDKQYQEEAGQAWDLYEKKTKTIAEKVKEYVQVSRIIDRTECLKFKDSPIDNGPKTFEELFKNRECLTDGSKHETHLISKEKEAPPPLNPLEMKETQMTRNLTKETAMSVREALLAMKQERNKGGK